MRMWTRFVSGKGDVDLRVIRQLVVRDTLAFVAANGMMAATANSCNGSIAIDSGCGSLCDAPIIMKNLSALTAISFEIIPPIVFI